ncbi:MAG TPA: sec-independent translocase [Mycobacteriales bacterium]|nr:sec-independent translocase [Mycobacteriales bacterium]
MFNSLGWGEIAILVVIALLIFGPDRLPSLARDAARMLRQVREMAQGARSQIKSELGPEFADLDLNSLNPRAFVRKHLFEDDDLDWNPPSMPGDFLHRPTQRTLADGEQAPFDPDTT